MTAAADPLSGTELESLISASRLRLRMHTPFFAALAMFAEVRFSEAVALAATDGRTLLFHPQAYAALPVKQRDALFLHELLHAALLHPVRRGVRDQELFNIAADLVVNGMIAAEGSLQLPDGAIRDERLEHHSVEEIYELLQKRQKRKRPQLPLADLLAAPITTSETAGGSPTHRRQSGRSRSAHTRQDESADQHKQGRDSAVEQQPEMDPADRQELEAHWKQAIQQAQVLLRSQGKGDLPAALQRHLDEIVDPQLDWRSQLWRYLVHTPNDYAGFDRRFIHQGLYLDHLEGESVEVFCCIDTSGSVGEKELSLFLGELKGILSAYPMLRCCLWYADAKCYGPYELIQESELPAPEGGGGTDFRPFFKQVQKTWSREKQAVCVYLTDGFGNFPRQEPELPTLWVVVPGGLENDEFPWGEAVRIHQ
ncbi:VWA-like domain-containing protein [Synechococcus sp. CCY9201]|uniref:vWA domain-containing protein n=1 Tax=Synechococcus sp. CCY9201 TaxID=174697 RepID=UPI002B20C5ED|nr:VWA-like domain-containing protein [Synechococcus sp. CCY9201]MEA5474276.1 VWA-like domain-containing protein [Synechococcus sp. CCY9201]